MPTIPMLTLRNIHAYVNDHRPVGSFLERVFSNDLVGAVTTADDENIICLKDIVLYINNYCPSQCWGSKEAIKNWLENMK